MSDIDFCKIELKNRIDTLKRKPKTDDEERDLLLFEAILAVLERFEQVKEVVERCVDDGL